MGDSVKKLISLAVVPDPREIFERIEREIVRVFRRELYLPIIREFGEKTLRNAKSLLLEALRTGRVTFNRGRFSGQFSAGVSKELRALGATWDRGESAFRISKAALPPDVQQAIAASDFQFRRRIEAVRERLSRIVPEELSEKVRTAPLFEDALWKTERGVNQSLRGLRVPAQLADAQRRIIADEWRNNMDLWIRDFTEKEIVELRTRLEKSVLAGNRYESAIQIIQDSFGVTQRKAKFLASQETRLLVCKFKEVRYQVAGVHEYKWKSVSGTKSHPVRPRHRELNDESARGKTFRFDDPPVSTGAGEPARRNNPGEDYNCRCTAIPVVSFRVAVP